MLRGLILFAWLSSHLIVSKIKPCKTQCKPLRGNTANDTLKAVIVYLMAFNYMDTVGNSKAKYMHTDPTYEGLCLVRFQTFQLRLCS